MSAEKKEATAKSEREKMKSILDKHGIKYTDADLDQLEGFLAELFAEDEE